MRNWMFREQSCALSNIRIVPILWVVVILRKTVTVNFGHRMGTTWAQT